MYASRTLVILCQPKTGSTTARHVAHVNGPGTTNIGRVHATSANWRDQWRVWARNGNVPDELNDIADDPDLRVVGTLREPAGWYRSVYKHTLERMGPDGLRSLARWTGGATDYPTVLRSWVEMGAHDRRPSVCEMLYPADGRTLYEASLRHYYGAGVDGWIRLEHQRSDLARELGVPYGNLRHTGRRNVSSATELAPVAPSQYFGDIGLHRRALSGAW